MASLVITSWTGGHQNRQFDMNPENGKISLNLFKQQCFLVQYLIYRRNIKVNLKSSLCKNFTALVSEGFSIYDYTVFIIFTIFSKTVTGITVYLGVYSLFFLFLKFRCVRSTWRIYENITE